MTTQFSDNTELEQTSNESGTAGLVQDPCASTDLVPNGGNRVDPGALPGNTAPANCIEPVDSTKILRSGIDSLYVSYQGTIRDETEQQLIELKKLAQSSDSELCSQAFLELNDHCFEVKGRGANKHAFVLQDNWFHLKIASATATQIPMLYGQISSELLTTSGLMPAATALKGIALNIGQQVSKGLISRIDLCVDFVTEFDFSSVARRDWVTYSKKYQEYFEGGVLTGFTFGQGSSISARLYNKSFEAVKRKKEYFFPAWEQAGWDGEQTVWRLEFQIKAENLRQFNLDTVRGIQPFIPLLWNYCTEQWLRLTIPSDTDSTSSRWPVHPVWQALIDASWEYEASSEPLYKIRKDRAPSDDYLFINGISAITSLMARDGIGSFDVAVEKFKLGARAFHKERSKRGKPDLEAYATDKSRQKACKYNTAGQNKKEGI